MTNISEIQKADKENKIIVGRRNVIKSLKRGELKNVVFASNTPQGITGDIGSLAKTIGAKVEIIDLKGDEFGAKCKRPFSISVIGIKG